MNFQKKQLKTEVYSKTFSTKRGKKNIFSLKSSLKKGDIAKVGVYSIMMMSLILCIGGIIIYSKYIKPLPSIQELENISIAESSTIYDKDGNELYKVYKEKRTYVPIEDISSNMKNAIVSGEDRTFFENSGIDFKRMIGAFVYYILGKTDKVEGTSTISQQLIRNTLIGSERKLERKIKEMYLSYKLNSGISKEKILELYLNKISYGNNAYGIEQASQTYFGKSAKDLDVLQSSILASLPKGPTYYSPYNHPDRLLGFPYIYSPDSQENSEDEVEQTKIIDKKDMQTYSGAIEILMSDLKNLSAKRLSSSSLIICGLKKEHIKSEIAIDSDGCTVRDYSKLLGLLNAIKIEYDGKILEYQTGRKDFILGRMLEDEKIEFKDYQDALINSIGFKFNDYVDKIKYPYFVFYVKDYIEKKYGTGMLEQAGLKIYTTIDPQLQDKAEELVKDYSAKYKTSINADNAALISIDNKTGHIISMVGGRDYFDTENKGNVNIITSFLQPGSSFKPFVYALAMDKKQLGTKSPIYDIKTDFGSYTPKNFDGKFMGKIDVSTALNNSRNIPAIKMYFFAGQEKAIKSMMKNFGVQGIREDINYGPPMALGTAEIKAIDLAGAYTIFANLGVKKQVTPILKIVDSKGQIIEDNTKEPKGEVVFDNGSSFLINKILSDTSARPDTWNKYLTLSGRPVAAKTGTSTKQYTKANGEKVILPRNLWTAGYTPQITTVVWVGNTDGSEVSLKGDGLQSAGPIWRDFMNFAHKGLEVEDWKMPNSVKMIEISEISGLLPPEGFPSEYIIGSYFKNIPRAYDASLGVVKIDALCNGKVGQNTPITAVKEVYQVAFHTFEPKTYPSWEAGVQQWAKSEGFAKVFPDSQGKTFVSYVDPNECDRVGGTPKIEVSSSINSGTTLINGANYIEVAYNGENPITSMDILLADNKIDTISLGDKTTGTYKGSFFIPEGYYGKYNLTIRAIDSKYYFGSEIKEVSINQNDNQAPIISLSSPSSQSVSIKQGEPFEIIGTSSDQSPIKSINIYLDNTPEKLGLKNKDFSYTLNENGTLAPGVYNVTIEAIDNTFNTGKQSFELTVIPNENSIEN